MNMPLVKAHRFLAIGLGIFIISHFAIHLSAIGGPEVHVRVLSTFQVIYRNRLVEPLLMLAILTQMFIGLKLIWRRWRQPHKDFWGWAQIVTGLYLVLFFALHTSAALITRYIVGLDTNFYWAAGTLNVGTLKYFFAPYYFFAIFSIFTHLASAVHFGWSLKGKPASIVILLLGICIATLIVTIFSGGFYEINLPSEYIQYFEGFN